MFNGPRPEIDPQSLYQFGQAYDPGDSLTFDVALGETDAAIRHVALHRPASVTHSFDFNQRYVEANLIAQSSPDPSGVVSLSVTLPPSSKYTPPGWYFLTAVDRKGRPSPGRWIQIDPL